MRCLRRLSGILFVSLLCGNVAFCEGGHHHHEAHQHGIGELGVVQEGSDFSITLRAPASDLVGFEHSAATKEEREALSKLEKLLGQPEKLFNFQSEAGCEDEYYTVSHTLGGKGTHTAHEGEGGHDHTHGHDHDHTHEHGKTSHSEISVDYRFSCADAKSLKTIQVNLFREFSTLERLDASVVTSSVQGKQQLTPSSTTIILSR